MKNHLSCAFACLCLGFLQCTSGNEKSSKDTASEALSAKIYVRKNAHSPEAQRDLEALDSALTVMRKMSCDNPLSWFYQGAIHWVPEKIPAQYPLCPPYAQNHQLQIGWDNCTHGPKEIPVHFLVWHRLYISHFEKIVRKLSGYDDFALPYWNYADDLSGKQGNRSLPALLRDSSSSTFEASRYEGINAGKPIDGAIARSLNLTNLFEEREFASFSSNFEQGLHGDIHDYVGMGNDTLYMISNPIYGVQYNGGLMSHVPSAGFDPVFWLHHAEVDHIWQMWTNQNKIKVTLDSLLANGGWKYIFFDENGKQVTYTLDSNFVDMVYNMNYEYDDLKPEKLLAIENLVVLQQDSLARIRVGQKIKGTKTKVAVTHNIPNNSVLKGLGVEKGNRIKLVLEISFDAQPRGPYEVYINLPNNQQPDTGSPNFVGSMNFFAATHHHSGHHGEHSMGGKKSLTFQFDVTDELLVSKAIEKAQFEITIYKHDGKTAKGMTLENVTIIRRSH